jgi:hypothetical protein
VARKGNNQNDSSSYSSNGDQRPRTGASGRDNQDRQKTMVRVLVVDLAKARLDMEIYKRQWEVAKKTFRWVEE